MGGWMGQCAELLNPLYTLLKEFVLNSKVVGTDDISVKVLDPKLTYARTGGFWPYCGDKEHPAIIYDYTPTRQRAGPEKFLEGYKGYLQADAYGGYDAFFINPVLSASAPHARRSNWWHGQAVGKRCADADPHPGRDGARNAVTLIPVHAELTTQEAADMLNISRPSLIQLLDEGKIEYLRVGTHCRVRFEAVMAYKRRTDAERRAVLAELAAYDQELGL